uniref:tRNA-splicing endonuclease subunit Sen34 n=1 Tax=Monopterus albus TaxID=43700 RepID=A0A3Q3R5Y8_MONAL
MDESPCRDEEDSSSSPVVGVGLCDSVPLLWRVEDLKTVRSWGLVGALLGSLPRTPRQNGRLGRPLLLLPEEERLLSERHAAASLPAADQDGGGPELHQQVEQYEEQQQRTYEEQTILALEDRKSALIRAMTPSHTGECVTMTTLHLYLQFDVTVLVPVPSGSQSGPGTAGEAFFTFPRSALAVQLSTARVGLSYCPETRAFLRADWPIRVQDHCSGGVRYQVFRDLRGRGFYLTSAGKFGGDFLVYPGDPLRFHAHFIAVCLSLDQSVCLLDILAMARLGSGVKKTVLLCSPGTDGGVVYTSLFISTVCASWCW